VKELVSVGRKRGDKRPGIDPNGSTKPGMPRGLENSKGSKGLKGMKADDDEVARGVKRSSNSRKIESKSSNGSLKNGVER